MSVTRDLVRPGPETGFSGLLRLWRQKRRLSQLDLALTAGVSQRHVSFLESGRANPSRNMILQLTETLEVPLRDRNAWLTAAGFAPLFRTRTLDDPQMGQVLAAVRMMLNAHEPFPAVALDRAWNARMSNAAFDRLTGMLGEDIWRRTGCGDERNLMRLFYHPEGIRGLVVNWSAIGPLVWQRARREAETVAGAEMKAVLDDLAPFQEPEVLWSHTDTALVPVMPFVLQLGALRLSMFVVVATFGTAQDVTADELRLETLFPADPETEAWFRAIARPDA